MFMNANTNFKNLFTYDYVYLIVEIGVKEIFPLVGINGLLFEILNVSPKKLFKHL